MAKKRIFVVFFFVLSFLLLPYGAGKAGAQDTQAPSTGQVRFSTAEIQQMVAAIALYPDSLLSQIFMASTYPIEVVEAARWIKQNPDLKGDALDTALKDMTWDVSVKSLAHFPDVLGMMSDKIDWMTKLGNAFLAQQQDVLDAVQFLRKKAQQQGNLMTTPQQRVTAQDNVIMIASVDPGFMYLPYYDPLVVYGGWWNPAYPPYWYPYNEWAHCHYALCSGKGYPTGPWANRWSNINWQNHQLLRNMNQTTPVNRSATAQQGPQNWQHDPQHRQGAAYRDQATTARYGQTASQARPSQTPGGTPARSSSSVQPAQSSQFSRIERDLGYGPQKTYDSQTHQWQTDTHSAFENHGGAAGEHAASERGGMSRSGGGWEGSRGGYGGGFGGGYGGGGFGGGGHFGGGGRR